MRSKMTSISYFSGWLENNTNLKDLLLVHQNFNFFKTFGHLLNGQKYQNTQLIFAKAFKHFWHLEERIFTRALSCVGSRLNCDYHPTCLNVRFVLSGLSWLWLCWLEHSGLFLSCTQTNFKGAFSNNIGKSKYCAVKCPWNLLGYGFSSFRDKDYNVISLLQGQSFFSFMYILYPSKIMEEPKKKLKVGHGVDLQVLCLAEWGCADLAGERWLPLVLRSDLCYIFHIITPGTQSWGWLSSQRVSVCEPPKSADTQPQSSSACRGWTHAHTHSHTRRRAVWSQAEGGHCF